MKRLSLLSVSLACFSILPSCEQEEYELTENSNNLNYPVASTRTESQGKFSMTSYNVTIEDAKKYMKIIYSNTDYNITPYVNQDDTIMYIVEMKDEWIALSADRRVVPVLAGGPDKFPSLENKNNYEHITRLNVLIDNLSKIKKDEKYENKEYTDIWELIAPSYKNTQKKVKTRSGNGKWVIRKFAINSQLTSEYTPHIIATKWGQTYPWNEGLPLQFDPDENREVYCPTGCVAVAVAQMFYFMHYDNRYNKPNRLYTNVSWDTTITSATNNIHFSKSNPTSSSYRWDNMPLNYRDTYGKNPSYVRDLMMEIGYCLNMKYSYSNSGTAFKQTYTNLQSHFNVSCARSSYSRSYVISSIQNNKPLIVGALGHETQYNQEIGHAWIIDGARIDKTEYTMMCYCEYTENYTISDEKYDTFDAARLVYGFESEYDLKPYINVSPTFDYHLFMNWGYDGVGDDMSFNADAPWIYREVGRDNYYNSNINIFYNFQ